MPLSTVDRLADILPSWSIGCELVLRKPSFTNAWNAAAKASNLSNAAMLGRSPGPVVGLQELDGCLLPSRQRVQRHTCAQTFPLLMDS
jgi:hypothetical protein